MGYHAVGFVAAFAGLWAANTLHAQASTLIPDAAVCPRCSIVLERVAQIGSVSDSALLGENARFAFGPSGIIVAASSSLKGSIAVYSSIGTLLRTIGRRGQGPGEFEGAADVVFDGSELIVWDRVLKRFSVFDSSFSFQRSFAFVHAMRSSDDVVVTGNSIVISSLYQSRSLPGVVAVLRSDGKGPPIAVSPEPAGTSESLMRRLIARSEGGRFWAGAWNQYLIQQFDTSGAMVASFSREVPWFRPWSEPGNPQTTVPVGQMLGVHEDREGLLWIAIAVADPKWDHETARAGDVEVIYDLMLEVFDPASGRILATSRVPAPGLFVGGLDPVIASPHRGANGTVTFALDRLRLVRP
jgi:hypothetical protein